jgi:hypothetical protein
MVSQTTDNPTLMVWNGWCTVTGHPAQHVDDVALARFTRQGSCGTDSGTSLWTRARKMLDLCRCPGALNTATRGTMSWTLSSGRAAKRAGGMSIPASWRL